MPVLTGKCLVRLRTEMTGTGESCRAPVRGRHAGLAQASFPAAISGARTQAERPPVSVGASGGGVSQTGSRNGQRGAKRQPGNVIGGRWRQSFDGCEQAGARTIEPRHRAQQSHGVGMARPVEHRVGFALFDHAAGIHHHDAMRVARDDSEIVRDDDQRDAEVARQRLHQFEDLRLDGDVERGGRLVGDDQLRIAGQPDRDHHALAHAAGKLMRILLAAAARDRKCRPAAAIRRRAHWRRCLFILRWNCSGSMICSPIGRTGLSEVIGSWKIIAISRPRTFAHLIFGQVEEVAALEHDAALRDAAGARQQPHDRMRGDRFAGAGFADQCYDLARAAPAG